jgi:hypothetical protein
MINDVENLRDCCGPDHMVVGFTTTYVISAYYWQSVLLVEEIGENHRPTASH